MILFMIIHVVYFAIFIYINHSYLSMMNIISILVYVYLIYILKENDTAEKVFLIARLEIFTHAFVCALALGWDYGFQNIILALISVSFFTNALGKTFGYVTAVLQGLAYVFLYFLSQDLPNINSTIEADIIYIFNFFLVVFALVIASNILKIFNTMVYLNMIYKQQELELIANKDHLTGLPNRRAFHSVLESNTLNLKRHISVAVADLDDFKKVNDRYGHSSGDEVLKVVANIFRTSLRKQDYAFRLGGEEFLIILTDTNFSNSDFILNRIREKIYTHTFEFGEDKVKISMTFGFVSVFVNNDLDMQYITNEADDMLAKGKRSGKNCVLGKVIISQTIADSNSENI